MAGNLAGSTKKSFDEVENDLGRDRDKDRGASKLSWDEAKAASRDAWNRVTEQGEGD